MSFVPSPAAIVIAHVDAVPYWEQAPPHPANVALPSGVAVKVTVEPCFM
jgi:hypothetical protein